MKKIYSLAFLFITCAACAFDATIPVLHLPDFFQEESREEFLKQFEQAVTEVGFFALTGTGVDPDMLDHTYGAAADFFALPWEEKLLLCSADGQRGFIPSESARGEVRADHKEYCHIGREFSEEELKTIRFGKNIWPDHPENFAPAMQELFRSLDDCKEAVSTAFSLVLEQDSNFVGEMVRKGDCLMRVIYYPANPPADAIWAAAHTDIDFFTILPRATAKGLQVLNKEDEWVDVLVPDGAFIVNCGDMLENISNGYFRSAVHRVADPGEGLERYSIVYFVHSKTEDRLDPLPKFIEKTGGVRKYANVTRLELLSERLIDLGIASKELKEFFVNSGAIEKLREIGRFSPKAEKALYEEGFAI